MKDYLLQAWLADCLGEPTGRESQAGRVGLEGTHNKTARKPHNTTQQHEKHVIQGKTITRK